MKKNKICIIIILGLMSTSILIGCGFSSDEVSSSETEDVYEALEVDYITNNDGTYTYNDNIYKYKIEVTGIEGEVQSTFVILTNDKKTSFEAVSASLKSAEMKTGVPEFVILGWY